MLRKIAIWLCLLLGAMLAAQAEEYVFSDLEALNSYLVDEMWMLKDEIELNYTAALDSAFASEDVGDYPLAAHCLRSWSISRSQTQRKITLSNIRYFPGYRAANAFTSVGEQILTGQEQQLLSTALNIVQQAYSHCSSEWELAMYLHDYLCSTVTYTSATSNDDYNTAIGALLYGRAECDGYADAYYLLCRLAGVQAYYESGETVDSKGVRGNHTWNLLNLNGRWYHVDVTWDDLDDDQFNNAVSYRYFACGADLIGENHFWEDNASGYPSAAHTDWTLYPYSCNRNETGIYAEDFDTAASYIAWRWRNGYGHAHVMVSGVHTGTDALNNALQHTDFRGRWWSWIHPIANQYTAYDIYFE